MKKIIFIMTMVICVVAFGNVASAHTYVYKNNTGVDKLYENGSSAVFSVYDYTGKTIGVQFYKNENQEDIKVRLTEWCNMVCQHISYTAGYDLMARSQHVMYFTPSIDGVTLFTVRCTASELIHEMEQWCSNMN